MRLATTLSLVFLVELVLFHTGLSSISAAAGLTNQHLLILINYPAHCLASLCVMLFIIREMSVWNVGTRLGLLLKLKVEG